MPWSQATGRVHDRNHGATVAFVWVEPLMERSDTVLAVSLDAHGAVDGFDKGSLEIAVDVAASSALADAAKPRRPNRDPI